ncbi:MAG TPA: PrsW family glutamic-type intramembrane protease [Candidatus Rifleibacterium sp.]|nr:PrsW family glutamic-type intramembrane protease [Candidatus Rifleibacterium sp.]HPT48179.1 PrsW family glutamic-type intramembrane protease [Candidatus Rifleibacterium sp.]
MSDNFEALFSLILLAPMLVFYLLFRKHWVDNDLLRSLVGGLIAGVAAIALTRLVYLPVEIWLGADLRSFISGPQAWWVTLVTSIAVIGFVEESLKTAGGLLASHYAEYMRRPTAIFMGLAGCAMSFSLLENIQYYLVFGSSVVMPRILISSSAHLFFISISAVFAAGAATARKKANSTAALRIMGGIAIASLIHGLFDFFVFHFDIQAASGLIVSLISLFWIGIYEAWLAVLKIDLPEEPVLATCSGCGAFSLDRVRFCGFCGSRLLKPQPRGFKVTDLKES